MAKILDREATIKTASVEIKALTVSGRQVTLALFRQLQHETVIDSVSRHLRGVPWGRVNYHVGCEQSQGAADRAGDHLHVVWQKGEELRRDCVWADGWRPVAGNATGGRPYRYRAAALMRECVWGMPTIAGEPAREWRGNRWLEATISYAGIEDVVSGPIAASVARYCETLRLHGRAYVEAGDAYDRLKQALREEWGWLVGWKDRQAAEWLDEFDRLEALAEQIETDWNRQYLGLGQLDQLFIAL